MSNPNNPSKASKNLVDYLKSREQFSGSVYPDQAGWDTVGYGHKLTPTEKRNGTFANGVTEAEAEALLAKDLVRFEKAVAVGVNVEINQNQFDALVSFAFNIGPGAFAGSTALAELNKGNTSAVPGLMGLYNKVRQKGTLVVSNGLVNRRTDENKIFEATVGTFPSNLSTGPGPGPGPGPTPKPNDPTPPPPHDRQAHDREGHDRDPHDRAPPSHDRAVHDRHIHDREPPHDRGLP